MDHQEKSQVELFGNLEKIDLPINTLSQSNEKNISQILIEGHYAKYLTSNPQNCQAPDKLGNLRNYYSQEET